MSASAFWGTLIGRRLLLVYGARHENTNYRFDDQAAYFCLALEGDTPSQVVWLLPTWQYRGPNFGFDLDVKVQHLGVGLLPELKSPCAWVQRPQWQALSGLCLQTIKSKTLYDAAHVAALSLQFAPQPFDEGVGKKSSTALLFDAEDLDEPFLMMVSDDKRLGHWVLRDDVQYFAKLEPIPWNTPWTTPPHPWNNWAHFTALSELRAEFQILTLWWTTQTRWPVDAQMRHAPAAALWQALTALSQWHIALAQGMHWVERDTSWRDRDGDEVDRAWVNLSGGYACVQNMATDLQSVLPTWQEWADLKKWELLCAGGDAGLLGDLRLRLRALLQAYSRWQPSFEACFADDAA